MVDRNTTEKQLFQAVEVYKSEGKYMLYYNFNRNIVVHATIV